MRRWRRRGPTGKPRHRCPTTTPRVPGSGWSAAMVRTPGARPAGSPRRPCPACSSGPGPVRCTAGREAGPSALFAHQLQDTEDGIPVEHADVRDTGRCEPVPECVLEPDDVHAQPAAEDDRAVEPELPQYLRRHVSEVV